MEIWENLENSIKDLSDIIRERTSYKYKLISWLITWVATAIGATVIAWLVIYSLSFLVKQIDLSSYPAIENMMQEADLIDEKK